VLCCAGIRCCEGTGDTLRVTAQKVVKFLYNTLEISGVRGGAVGCGRNVAGSIPDGVIGILH